MPARTLPGRDAEPMAYREPYQYAFVVASPVWISDLSQKFFHQARWPASSAATSASVSPLALLDAWPASVAADGPPLPARASVRNTVASCTVEPPLRVNVPVAVFPLVPVLLNPTPTGRTAIAAWDWKSPEPVRLLRRVAVIVPPEAPTVVGYVVCESLAGIARATVTGTAGLPAGLDSSV